MHSSRESRCRSARPRELSGTVLRFLSFFLILAGASSTVAAPLQIRVATFNSSLNRTSLGQLASDLSVTTNNQAKRIAEIIQRVRPDILLINEFDYDAANPTVALNRFHDNYLAVSQGGQPVLNYPYRYVAPSNTGIPSGFDFDNNGSVGVPSGRTRTATTVSASASFPANTASPSIPNFRSRRRRSAPSNSSNGRICRGTLRRRGFTPRRSWRCSGFPQKTTSICRSR